MERKTLSTRLKDTKGTVTIMVVLLLLVLIGFAAFAIDVGHMMLRRNELQNVADTAALAATGELGAVYTALSYSDTLGYAPASGPLLAKAQQVADSTGTGGIVISSADFRLGKWDPATHTLTPAATMPTAVKVTVRKDGTANDAFPTFLAGVLGIGSFDVAATATASLTSLYSTTNLPLPVGISQYRFERGDEYCDQPIRLNPSNDLTSCAGWNVYTESPHSNNVFRTVVEGLTDGSYVNTGAVANQTTFNFTGGNLGEQAFNDVEALFDARKILNDGDIDKDEDSNTWTTTVPVYAGTDCFNPKGYLLIVGFSTITITKVSGPPEMIIDATIKCDIVTNGPGGNGLTLWTYGKYPNLVQ